MPPTARSSARCSSPAPISPRSPSHPQSQLWLARGPATAPGIGESLVVDRATLTVTWRIRAGFPVVDLIPFRGGVWSITEPPVRRTTLVFRYADSARRLVGGRFLDGLAGATMAIDRNTAWVLDPLEDVVFRIPLT